MRYEPQRLFGADRLDGHRAVLGARLTSRRGRDRLAGAEIIARHQRSYEREDSDLDFLLHYLGGAVKLMADGRV